MALQHTDLAKKFYNSKQWLRCRKAYIVSVHGLCEHCFKKGIIETGHIVDHIEEININNINDPNITLNHDNLQYLCLPCHNKKTFKKNDGVPKDCTFDENGNLIYLGKE